MVVNCPPCPHLISQLDLSIAAEPRGTFVLGLDDLAYVA